MTDLLLFSLCNQLGQSHFFLNYRHVRFGLCCLSWSYRFSSVWLNTKVITLNTVANENIFNSYVSTVKQIIVAAYCKSLFFSITKNNAIVIAIILSAKNWKQRLGFIQPNNHLFRFILIEHLQFTAKWYVWTEQIKVSPP
jgi:hypothetical protein